MHVLSVSSLKGGVGKTTVALGLASAAFARGLRTLVVDLDPQCDATTGLGAIGEFKETSADVLETPRHNVVHKAIVASSWGRVGAGKVDILVGSPNSINFDTPHPTIRDVWKLEEALSRVEDEYDLVIVDTPPSINGLTRTAWVASDRVLVVSEPAIFSVVAADRAIRAIKELSKGLVPRLRPVGVVLNRYRPQSKEHEFRVKELETMFGDVLLEPFLEEKANLQQAQGAARPIHSWPGEGSVEVAQSLDRILEQCLNSFSADDSKRDRREGSEKPVKRISKLQRIMRGGKKEAVLDASEDSDGIISALNELTLELAEKPKEEN